MKPITLNHENFETTVNTTGQPVLVDFWAEWCGPCKMIAPALDELAVEQAGQAVVAKANIDETPELAARFGITAIPTLIVFKNGLPVRTLRGVQSKAALASALTSVRDN
jgi:thioredoxin 1